MHNFRTKTFRFSVTEDISKNILGLYYAVRIAMTMVVALCVLALHVYCNTFNGKRLDEMIEDEVKEIKMKEEIRANVENVAVAVMKSGTESQVTKLIHSYLKIAQIDTPIPHNIALVDFLC